MRDEPWLAESSMHRRDALRYLLSAGALSASGAAHADLPSGTVRDDVGIVRAALELHPGLHRYLTPSAVRHELQRFKREFTTGPSLEDRYLALSRFLATVRCGHTYPNFYNQRRAVATALFDRRTRLPFEFRWMGGRMIVTRALAGLALAPGTAVIAVNNMPVARVLATLLPYARADGHNSGKRLALLATGGPDRIEFFDVYQGLLFPPAGESYRLEVRRPDGSKSTIDVPALSLSDRQAARVLAPDDGRPTWTWDERPDGLVVLTMPSWAMYNAAWTNWPSWLDDRLDSLEGRRGLIVDLRMNEGGDDCGDALLERLTATDLRFDAYDERLRFRRTPADLDPFLDTWDASFRTLGEGAESLGEGWYRRRPADGAYAVLRARAPRIRVPVAALVGPTNSSATFQFAQRAQQSGLVRLFGHETGGNLRGINGGCFFFVRLPASGLELDLPLIGYFPAHPARDGGVVPDVVIEATVEDVRDGRDRTLEAAVAWLRRV